MFKSNIACKAKQSLKESIGPVLVSADAQGSEYVSEKEKWRYCLMFIVTNSIIRFSVCVIDMVGTSITHQGFFSAGHLTR